ncbi:transcriptional regulator [Streptococcus downei MFe28]|uniref:Transcriptional regulator n=2 Tax=Streptococcus downei TaxID=1317 RepID=A0A380JD45_STRDO|nr:transcriptional regulator [Streptococcus downei MFe28]
MWVCYFLLVNSGDITQQDLVEHLMFPKQTIHSSVKKLLADQYVEVTALPGSRKSKKLLLTERGKHHTQLTVAKMLEAEKRAMKVMGQKEMQQYVDLQGAYLALVKEEFAKAGLLPLKKLEDN